MFIARSPLLLASASPRRQELLTQLGLEFTVRPADIDETPQTGERPEEFARRMAWSKAEQIAQAYPDSCVIAADTVVALDQRIFGKPGDRDDALAILQALQGRPHIVTTGFAVLCPRLHITEVATVSTRVTFATHDDQILLAYIDSGEPMDKAGAYGIQGKGAFLIRSIDGSPSNVIGLPINEVVAVLLKHHLIEARKEAMPRSEAVA